MISFALLQPADAAAFIFLLISLAAFIASTRQMSVIWRGCIWAIGTLALSAGIVHLHSLDGHIAIVRALEEAWTHIGNLEESVIGQALFSNAHVVKRYTLPLLDLLYVFAFGLACVALAALTPGQLIERIGRPLMFGALGAVIGAGAALAVVAIAFGGPVDPRRFAGMGEASKVYDGDTFWIGDVSVRLEGIDAPERRQKCIGAPTLAHCGELSRQHLGRLIHDAVVNCNPRQNSKGKTTESFGRPLVACEISKPGETAFDLARKMIADGFAVPYRGEGEEYSVVAEQAAKSQAGLMGACSLSPDTWRNDAAARSAFLNNEALPGEAYKQMGNCLAP